MPNPSHRAIRPWRKRHGLSQTELARLLGLPEPERGGRITVLRWERGVNPPPPLLWLALEALERRLEENHAAE